MPNPLRAVVDYLRGSDLQAPGALARLEQQPLALRPLERKIAFTPSSYAGGLSPQLQQALSLGVLVHGPGAGDIYRAYASGGGLATNSAVFACLHTLATDYAEAPLRVYRGDAEGGDPTVIVDHPLEELVANPNESITGPSLCYWTQWTKQVDGNAYWLKVRAPAGNVVELWPISPSVMRPYTEKGDRTRGIFISYYEWKPSSTVRYEVPVEDVVHFRLGLDPYDARIGLSPLKNLVREVCGDDEATRFSEALLRNFAIPGLVVEIPREESRSWTREKAEELKEDITSEFGSDKRGHVGVLTGGAKMSQFGFSPQDLNLQMLHRLPEERISAVLRVPAIVAGLGAGLDRSTYANMREAREMYTETALLPQYVFDAATINQQLLPDFTGAGRGPIRRVFARHDLTKMRALQEDEDRLWARLGAAVLDGRLSIDEARARMGYGPRPDAGGGFAQPAAKPAAGAGAGQPAGAPPVGGDQRRNGSANRMLSGGKTIDWDQLRRRRERMESSLGA